MSTATLITENRYGAQLRRATRRADTWPGYHESCPLGRAGYWFGTEMSHQYLGRDRPDADTLAALELEVEP